ncbi:unnamed protein product [Cuscuta epithymum]|uniref:Uncharacterized protein n=1 Tax=Cuscuta epithymum TaxID=186058 RepID=A0AAV0D5H6_9ASTE|nr:unnamed protein product [Cuscuta epithymum]
MSSFAGKVGSNGYTMKSFIIFSIIMMITHGSEYRANAHVNVLLDPTKCTGLVCCVPEDCVGVCRDKGFHKSATCSDAMCFPFFKYGVCCCE